MDTKMVDLTVTCTTEGCENSGIPLNLLVPEDNKLVICGPCGRVIHT